MPFYDVQNVYKKNQLGTRLDKIQIQSQKKKNIIRGKTSGASFNRVGGSGWHLEPLSRGFREWSPLRKILGSKNHPDCLKIDANAVEIITVQDYKFTKNYCEWKYICTVLKLRVKQVTYESMQHKKPQDTQLGILKIYAFCREIQQRTLSPIECCWSHTSVYENSP